MTTRTRILTPSDAKNVAVPPRSESDAMRRLSEAQTAIDDGDFARASLRLCEAADSAVNRVAENRGWQSDSARMRPW